MTFKGQSRSSKSEISLFDGAHMISYYRSIVTIIALSYLVSFQHTGSDI